MPNNRIKIIGAGLAGCEATLQLANKGWSVDLYEMRPDKTTAAHQTSLFAELVCSNSLKSDLLTTASGLLKEELRLLDCQLLKIAANNKLPAGNALAVDRENFAREVTSMIENSPDIRIIREEVTVLTDEKTIIATGPLSSSALINSLQEWIGNKNLYFYDAIAPIIAAESIDTKKVYSKARYDKGSPDYLNCPFTRTEYMNFVNALLESEKYLAKEFETEYFQELTENKDINFYENCIPIEEIARRGVDTLRFGVMRPVGLELPETKERPYAVLQLRVENQDKSAYNLVGCQTMMTQGSQKKVFRLIPGLEKAEFYRYGSIHRNTYLNAPEILDRHFSLKNKPNVYIAGQLSGVEGYVESIASGLLVSMVLTNQIRTLPAVTILGQLWRRLTIPEKGTFIPINSNYGLLPALDIRIKDKNRRKELLAERSIKALHEELVGTSNQ